MIWLLVLIPTLDWESLRRELKTPAGVLPVALVALGVLGMLWADVTWFERWKGLESFLKLLMIPLLLVQFRRSDRVRCVFGAYLGACALVLLVSSVFYLWPGATFLFTKEAAVPVKNAATQSGEFVTCIFGLLYLAIDFYERRRWLALLGALALALGFLANILYVATGRTALVVMLVLLVARFAKLSVRIAVFARRSGSAGGIAWTSSPHLRTARCRFGPTTRCMRRATIKTRPASASSSIRSRWSSSAKRP